MRGMQALRALAGAAAVLGMVLAGAGCGKVALTQQRESLAAAASAGDVKALRAALSARADVNAADASGVTPLMEAARGDRPSMSNPTATDHPEAAAALIQGGADVNAATPTGFTALFWAARYGHEKVVETLLQHGARADAKDKDGLSPLKWAKTNRDASPTSYDRVISLLERAGAKE